jgi:hypothetical protein
MRHPEPAPHRPTALSRLVSVLVLAAPAVILGLCAARDGSGLLGIGAVAALLGGVLFVRHPAAWRPPASGSVVLLYLIALGWLWFATRESSGGLAQAGRGLLLLGAVGILVSHDLVRTGLEPRRRATVLCQQLKSRKKWPAQLAGFAELPEVRALQEAVRDDPGPAVRLFTDPRAEVRTAAFLALRTRKKWRPGESAATLDAIRRTIEPGVRAAGVLALSGTTDPDVVDTVAGYLRDPSPEVRQAAAMALLTDGSRRWPMVREYVRSVLADSTLTADGPLPGAAGRIPPMAVCDLTTWAGEPEPLAGRAVRTLVEHFATELRTADLPHLPAELGAEVLDPQTPPILRLELAALLRGLGLVTPELLDRMTDADQPGPVRLLAAEMMLAHDATDPVAIDVLRGLGRQSHRETVLTIAHLLQTYLGVDVGLPDGPPLAANSKAAAEAAKRVFQWATGKPLPYPDSTEVGSAWVTRPVAQAALPALKQTAPPPVTKPTDQSATGTAWIRRSNPN